MYIFLSNKNLNLVGDVFYKNLFSTKVYNFSYIFLLKFHDKYAKEDFFAKISI